MNRGSWVLSILVACVLGVCSGVGEAKAQFTDCSAITGMPQSECQALVDLYDSTNGANWTTKTGWKQTTTPCTWFRVTCSGGHVTQLQLYSNNLVGTIPASIGDLTSLTSLPLYSNQLSGSIPSSIGNLANLSSLNLTQNQLSGAIPDSIGNLSNLADVRLTTNQLSGSIPSTIGNLTKLVRFWASNNKLSGSIPISIGNLSKLQEIWLDSNQLTGSIPIEIGSLVNLTSFRLGSNHLNGTIPTSIGNLINLTGLSLYNNQLTGSIPNEIGNLVNLTALSLNNNQLSGIIPPEIGNLTKLTALPLHVNQLTGPVPDSIGNLVSLTSLTLNNNQLSGNIPIAIGNLLNLTDLQMQNNLFTGNIPTQIGNLTKLTNLQLYNNQLSGSIPTEIGSLVNLTSFRLSSNQLTGNLPTEIGNLTKLQTLNFSFNQLGGIIPSSIGNLTNLVYLFMNNNQLSGSIPEEIGNLVNLTYLYLYSNLLTGSIPQEIGNLTKLNYLILNANKLSGNIPDTIANLTSLYGLYLHTNHFTGNIPTGVCNLLNLTTLQLFNNALTGELPECVVNLSWLSDLQVQGNLLTGELPTELFDKNLTEFGWYRNHFLIHVSGRITDSNGQSFSGATVTVSGPYQTTTVTDQDGNYSVEIPDGYNYTLIPSTTGYCFQQAERTGTMDAELLGGLTLTGQDFTATLNTYTISGVVKEGDTPLSGVSVNAGSGTLGSQTTDVSGHYSFSGIPHGTQMTITPSKAGYSFTPASQQFTVTSDITFNLNATLIDADGDGLSDLDEEARSTNPNNSDTDGDGVSDSEELTNGTNPLDKGSAEVTRPATLCSEWNGYLGMYNALEHVNLATNGRKYTTTLYSLAGDAKAPVKFSIAGGGEYDLLVHELNGFENDRYGKVCTTVTNGSSGELDGRMVFYKPDAANGGYQFAFAMPLGIGLTSTQYVPYNTYQPSIDPVDASNLVANWIQITNLSTSKQTGNLVFYDRDGAEIARQEVALKAGARFDFSGHDLAGRSQVGLVEWIPTASTARFQLRNVRYYYRADGVTVPLGDDFDSAFQLEGVVGSGQTLTVPLDTENSSSVLELANTLNEEVNAEVTIYAATGGEALHHQTYKLKPHATYHLIADTILNGSQGVATVKGDKPASVIATAMEYGRTETLGIQTVYGIQASEARGTVMRGSYNTFLKQDCRLLMVNPTSAESIATVSMKRYDGTEVNIGQRLKVPAHGLTDYDLCSQDQENVYGVVTVQPDTPNTIFATVLRIGESEQYRFPTPVRD